MLLFAGSTSCKKETPAPTEPSTTNPKTPPGIAIGTIKAKVNGEVKTADRYVTAQVATGVPVVYIAGSGGPATNLLTFNLTIGDFSGTGTYDLGVNDTRGLGIVALYQEISLGGYSCSPQYTETSGKLTVTEYEAGKRIKGTFHYRAKKQGATGSGGPFIDVTEGEFFISLE